MFSRTTTTSDSSRVATLKANHHYIKEFQAMNSLIDDNRDYQLIEQQLHQDKKSQHQANVIIRKNQTKTKLVDFLHAACFAPVKSTFIKAIKNNHFVSWPGLDVPLVTKHLGVNESTEKDICIVKDLIYRVLRQLIYRMDWMI